MLDDSKWIYEGIKLFKTYCPSIKQFIIGIETNKPECIEEMARIFADEPMVTIKPLAPNYPQGAEKVLIYNTTGRVVPEGKLPADVSCMVINVTSLASYAKYVHTGMPLVSRVVTVDGSAIASPKNVIVPIGTSVGDVISFVRGDDESDKIGKVLFGGPMMGISAESMSEPITKTTGGLTVMNERDAKGFEPTACIHCGRCVISCPHLLNPTVFAKALKIENKEERMEI
jgi:electron transport complex protein RnfC